MQRNQHMMLMFCQHPSELSETGLLVLSSFFFISSVRLFVTEDRENRPERQWENRYFKGFVSPFCWDEDTTILEWNSALDKCIWTNIQYIDMIKSWPLGREAENPEWTKHHISYVLVYKLMKPCFYWIQSSSQNCRFSSQLRDRRGCIILTCCEAAMETRLAVINVKGKKW